MIDVTVYIGLGSNLGDRRRMIEAALQELDRLDGVEVAAVSPLIETEPFGPPGQPRYLNGAVGLHTMLCPRDLLTAMHELEVSSGRDRHTEQRWGPRRLDLDLLLWGDLVIDEPGLAVPHPRMHERLFVLEPLALIAPGAVHPILRLSVECLRERARSRSVGIQGDDPGVVRVQGPNS